MCCSVLASCRTDHSQSGLTVLFAAQGESCNVTCRANSILANGIPEKKKAAWTHNEYIGKFTEHAVAEVLCA